jgi:muramoyltetrapeptide carboxypeptidase
MKKAFLISPSGYSGKHILNNSISSLKKLGYQAKFNPDILSRYYYYAGDFKRRAKEINDAYNDKETKLIFTLIGGMGAVHTLPYLDYKKIKSSNKILIGSSDITILLNSINKLTNATCIHGPNFSKPFKKYDPKTISCLMDVLNKKDYQVKINEKDVLVKGLARAKIIGGNLTLLERSLGTAYEIDTNGRILFIEDIKMNEGWVLDILWHLKIAKKFDNIKGIILGYFINCGNNIDKYLVDFFKDFSCPVIINQPIGHSEPNLSIPMGEECIIDTKNNFWRIHFNNNN